MEVEKTKLFSILKVSFLRIITSTILLNTLFSLFFLSKEGKYNILISIAILILVYTIQAILIITDNQTLNEASMLEIIKFFIRRYIKAKHSISSMMIVLAVTFFQFLLFSDDMKPDMIPYGICICIATLYIEIILNKTLRDSK